MSCFFVTGTDTNVGKTTASRAIIQALQNTGVQIVGYKPIACGQEISIRPEQLIIEKSDYDSEDNPDVLTLLHSTNQDIHYREANSYTFDHLCPMITEEAERINVDKINQDLDRLNQKYQSVLVEGSFGWLTPMTKEKYFSDWVVERKMPVVLVVGIKDGCVNHALLTAQSIQNMGLPLIGWIANRINPCLNYYAEIIQILEEKIDAPLIGKIPYIQRPEDKELGRYLTNIDRLTYMKTEIVK